MALQTQEFKDEGALFSQWAAMPGAGYTTVDEALRSIRHQETWSPHCYRVVDTDTGEVLAYGDNYIKGMC